MKLKLSLAVAMGVLAANAVPGLAQQPCGHCPPNPCNCPPAYHGQAYNGYIVPDDSGSVQSDVIQSTQPTGDFNLAPAAGTGLAMGAASTSLPNVIADSPLGTCATVSEGDTGISLGHPNLQCSRLNLAENNSPIPRDRAFITYRHFENPTNVGFFGEIDPADALFGLKTDYSFDVEQVVFGLERTAFDGLVSLEVRLPFAAQLSSDLDIRGLSGVNTVPEANSILDSGLSERFEIGNMSLVLKALLAQNERFALSGGLGILLPTAKHVDFRGVIPNVNFGGNAGLVDLDFAIDARNETVDLLPFLGYTYTPNELFFTQGFFQLAIPLNSSDSSLVIGNSFGTAGTIAGNNAVGNYSSTITGQTLMRLNTQLGCWLYQNPCRNTCVDRVAALLEFHWTSTLEDAETDITQLIPAGLLGDPVVLATGNPANRVDVVNSTFGMSFEKGLTSIVPALTLPLTSGDNEPFDWEAAILVNRAF